MKLFYKKKNFLDVFIQLIKNCNEKILEILANNVNATEQSMNKIIEIAQLVGVEINNI